MYATLPTNPAPTLAQLLALLVKVTGDSADAIDNPGNGSAVYTHAEWADRGEDYGNDAMFVLVHDGGPLAPYCNGDYEAYGAMEALREALEGLGLWAEQCTSWYTAIYPLEG